MIIPDEDDAQKIKDPPVDIPTVRHPEPAATRPLASLPDYETSQALAFGDLNESQITLYKPPPRRRILDSRFWRAALISLVVYIFLTLVVGVPIIVHVSFSHSSIFLSLPFTNNRKNTRTSRNTPLTTRLLMPLFGQVKALVAPTALATQTSQAPSNQGYILSAITGQWLSTVRVATPPSSWRRMSLYLPLTLFVDPFRSFSRTENFISPSGQFSLTSNASWVDELDFVQGAFYTGLNPDETVQEAVLSIVMQSTSPGLFSRTSTCLAAADNFTDLFLYVCLSSSCINCSITAADVLPGSGQPHFSRQYSIQYHSSVSTNCNPLAGTLLLHVPTYVRSTVWLF